MQRVTWVCPIFTVHTTRPHLWTIAQGAGAEMFPHSPAHLSRTFRCWFAECLRRNEHWGRFYCLFTPPSTRAVQFGALSIASA